MVTAIDLLPEIDQRLETLVARTGCTKAFLLYESIVQGLEEIEDNYRALTILERVRTGEEQVYSSATVRKALELDN